MKHFWVKYDGEKWSSFFYELFWNSTKGPFTNYVYKRRGVGGQKNQPFVNFYTIENVNGGGVGGQKKPNLVNVFCERPLTVNF